MKPFSALPLDALSAVHTVFTDIDDTLTSDGELPASAYGALERLRNCGVAVVPITGRPAGWCDMIARFWPVSGIVGENGALCFAYDRTARKMHRAFFAGPEERRANRVKLDRLRDRILAEVPGAGIASDQPYREADLAIDICEDVEPLARGDVDRILALFAESGATAKLSSVHVNGWFGHYDKLSMTRRFASEVLGYDLEAEKDRALFVGDSPNDGPMFGFFPLSCGVANIRAFAPDQLIPPSFVAEGHGGAGFVEIARRLVAARGGGMDTA